MGVKELRKQYDIQRKPLGQGSYGQVFKATNRKDKDFIVAIKVIEKTGLSKEEIDEIMNEVEMLKALDHPNIVKYYETYDDVKFLYLVMQYCPGGELFDSFEHFEKKGIRYDEKNSAAIIKKLLSALQHCHSS
jgi:calcium-dependent protein kinase